MIIFPQVSTLTFGKFTFKPKTIYNGPVDPAGSLINLVTICDLNSLSYPSKL